MPLSIAGLTGNVDEKADALRAASVSFVPGKCYDKHHSTQKMRPPLTPSGKPKKIPGKLPPEKETRLARYSLPEKAQDDAGFQRRDLIRFFIVDIILIAALRLLLGLGIFPSVDAYVLAILGSKGILFIYLLWLIRDRRQAWPETGATTLGRWWSLPLAVVVYAATYPALIFVNSANRILMLRLHHALGWMYRPQPQDVMFFIFEDILQTPVRIVLIVFTALLGPFMEELAFRGLGIDAYRRTGGALWAVVWTSLLFGLYHFDLNLLLPLSFLGMVFGVLRVATRSLWSPLLAHCLHNSFTLLVMAHGLGLIETPIKW